jgi:hypothetical protein
MDALCHCRWSIEIGNEDLCTLCGQTRRDRAADPAGTARNDRDLACKPSHRGTFSCASSGWSAPLDQSCKLVNARGAFPFFAHRERLPCPDITARLGEVAAAVAEERNDLSEDTISVVLAAEKRRCDAMLANDGAALAEVLDARLHFSHATGVVDDRDAFLAKMAAGRIRYIGITWCEEKVITLALDVAMLTGRMTTDVRVEGVDKRLNNRVITVWCRSGGTWRLVAFQSTPLAS